MPVITSQQADISVRVSGQGGTTFQAVIDGVTYLGQGNSKGLTGQAVFSVYHAQTPEPEVQLGFRRDATSPTVNATPDMLKFPGEP